MSVKVAATATARNAPGYRIVRCWPAAGQRRAWRQPDPCPWCRWSTPGSVSGWFRRIHFAVRRSKGRYRLPPRSTCILQRLNLCSSSHAHSVINPAANRCRIWNVFREWHFCRQTYRLLYLIPKISVQHLSTSIEDNRRPNDVTLQDLSGPIGANRWRVSSNHTRYRNLSITIADDRLDGTSDIHRTPD